MASMRLIVLAFCAGVALLTGTAFLASKPLPPPARENLGPTGILERRLQHVRGRDSAQELLLHTSAGHLYRDQGQYGKAAQHYDAARELAERQGSKEGRVMALRDISSADFHLGQLAKASDSLEKALELSGEQGEEATAVLRSLGNVRREQGRTDEAFDFYARSWQAARTAPFHGMELVHASLQAEIGEAHARRGDLKLAADHLQAALAQQEQLGADLGPKSPGAQLQLATTRGLLASVVQWQGDVALALKLYEQALKTQVANLRADHPDLVTTRLGYARALRDDGQAEEALREMDDLEQALREGTQEGPDLSRALVAKADMLREQGALDQAVAAATEARVLQQEVYGEDVNPEVAAALNVLGSSLHDQGNIGEAVAQYTLALDASQRSGGELHPETAAAHNSLGTAFADIGEDDAAEDHYRACLRIQQQTMPVDSADIATSYNNLATVLYRRGALLESSELLRRAVAVLDKAKIPAMNPERLFYQQSLEQVLQAMANPKPKPQQDVDLEEPMSQVPHPADDEPVSFAIA